MSRDGDTFGLEPELMRELGYWVVDRVVDHVSGLDQGPVIKTGSARDLRVELGGPLPELPGDPAAALQTLADTALSNMQHPDHPRYFARVPGPSSYAAVLGEWLATGFNSIATSWVGGSGPTMAELVALEWLQELIGLPWEGDGVLVSGGSIANMTALTAARHDRGHGVAYLSDQAHSSIVRALAAIGFAADQIRVLPSADDLRLDPAVLGAAISEDRAAGRQPRILIASAGTTNTGTVDPLPELADLAAAEGLWLHVDGAYGAPAAASAQGRAALEGLERADSLVLDPHKWLFQPIDAGCLFVRRAGVLERALTMEPEYLRDVSSDGANVEMRNRTLELTRRGRGLKLWMTFRTYGAARIREGVARGIALAEHAEAVIRGDSRWELVTPAQLGVVTFALRGAQDGEHARRAADVAASGLAAVSSTLLKDRSVLRLCTINPSTTEGDIEATLAALAA